MDSCHPYWNTETGEEFPQRKPFGLENELVELLWQNGEVVLHSQNNRKQSYRSRQVVRNDHPNNLIEDVDTASWIDCPIDESFEKKFCSNFLSDIPPFDPVESSKNVGSRQDFGPPPQIPRGECSIRSIGASHCASNQVDVIKVKEGVDVEQARTSCSGGSGSSFWKTSNDSSGHKRKSRDECPSDANELESALGNKGSHKSGTPRRTRVAQVHNMSERRRRDRINEKMKALQELIPHSNKSDKASMLDEAIEYMKSLQLQIQLMWMGRGMTPMMLPGMQQYMSRIGMGIGPPMLPAIQNLMRLSKFPLVDQPMTMTPTTNLTPVGQVNYQNQMQNSSFQQQYANFMGFPNSSQPTNMFNFGFHSPQQKEVSAPRGNGNGSVG